LGTQSSLRKVKRREEDTNFFAPTPQDSSEEKPKKERNLMRSQNANVKY